MSSLVLSSTTPDKSAQSSKMSQVKSFKKLCSVCFGVALLSLTVSACTVNSGNGESDISFSNIEACATRSYQYLPKEQLNTGMTISYEIAPEAVWEDGSHITADDFKATWDATLNTPGSLSTSGYDQVISVEAGRSDKQVVVTLKSVYAPYKILFSSLIKADSVEDTSDISQDFLDLIPFSGRAYKMESWNKERLVFVRNEMYWGDDQAVARKVVIVPVPESEDEISSIESGKIDFVVRQFFQEEKPVLEQDNIASAVASGSNFESIWLNQKCGPFADDIFRSAFIKSIDLDRLLSEVYKPIAPSAELLQCGPITARDYCTGNEFANSYDLIEAIKIMEGNGWKRNEIGYWEKDGVVPEIRWVSNTGNTRRERAQSYLIPLLQEAGFNVSADNCDVECYLQKRLPSMDYDLAMVTSTSHPDPGYLTKLFSCDQIPSPVNGFVGDNRWGWCNDEASDLLYAADEETDPVLRASTVRQVLRLMAADHVLLPVFQFPNTGIWRTDKVGGPIDGELSSPAPFSNFNQWLDVDGDGEIVIGVEQWPKCLNPITQCFDSPWMALTTVLSVSPGAFKTTNDGRYVVTNLLSGEPVISVR